MNTSRVEVFKKLIERSTWQEITDCYIWHGALSSNGYGHTKIDGKDYSVHRLSAWISLGLDLEGTGQVNHFCSNTMCWNPQHIYVGNQSHNIDDSVNRGNHYNASKTHCKHGHEFTPENTYLQGRYRSCKICRTMRNRREFK